MSRKKSSSLSEDQIRAKEAVAAYEKAKEARRHTERVIVKEVIRVQPEPSGDAVTPTESDS